MSSTNKTTNYELSQFIGSDKPAWLTDYNQDMTKIDTGIKGAADTATAADGKADANTTNIGDMSYLSTTAKNTLVAAINEVDNNADTAQNTANQAAGNAATAISKTNELIDKFDLSSVNNLTVTTNRGSITSHSMRIAKNSDGTIAKVYGNISWSNSSSYAGDVTITLSDTGLGTIESDFNVECAGVRTIYAGGINSTASCTLKYKTNGNIEYSFSVTSITSNTTSIFIPFVTFVKDFGDEANNG